MKGMVKVLVCYHRKGEEIYEVEKEDQNGSGLSPTEPSAKRTRLECQTCGKTFSRKDNLKRHMKVHQKEQKHQCVRCGKKFSRRDYLVKHQKVHEKHVVDREFKCNNCGQTFSSVGELRSHLKSAHLSTKETQKAEKRKRSQGDDQSKNTDSKRRRANSSSVNKGASSSWQSDSMFMPPNVIIPNSDQQIRNMINQHWSEIRTRQSRRNRLQDWYNFRLESYDRQVFHQYLQQILADQTTVFWLNMSFGFVLRNTETGDLQYYHASHNNHRVFDKPFLIGNVRDIDRVADTIHELDIAEWVKQQRPNSKWVVDVITNVTFFVSKIRDHPIGRSGLLPEYIMNNRGLIALDCKDKTGEPYDDHLCFFRCLALHNGSHVSSLEGDTKTLFERYLQSFPQNEGFQGIKLEDLPELEKVFQLNIAVYSLEPECNEENVRPKIIARLVKRSHHTFPTTLNLNLYNDHFSYIKSLGRYSKSFQCCKCGKYWKNGFKLNRHELKCEAKIRYRFPGSTYKTPKTIFDLLEDEGITIPDHLRFFPYRATFDFECMFSQDQLPKNSDKLSWQAKHVPLSVSVCSNVPQYQQPQCFITNGDSKELVQEMVEYLVTISKESNRLMKEQFADVLTAIDQKIKDRDANEKETTENEYDLESDDDDDDDDNDCGIDVLDSENDDEEEVESENEEDRNFIDDASMDDDDHDPGFYRAMDQELRDRFPTLQRSVHNKKEKKRQHPLVKLKVRLEEYLKELPVVGFNSGKYDLNATKQFLFPVLTEMEQIQFAIKRNNNCMCLKTEHLRFLDIVNFIAPGFSYDKFLKAYDCPQTKGFFPYEWMDSLDKLEYTALPPHEAFYSSLTNSNIKAQEYAYCQQVWAENNIQTFREFLVWYNNRDVVPFCDALEKMSTFWREKRIDMLRQGISIPGVTLTYLFMTLEPDIFFSLFDEKNKDLYYSFKSNMVGGPSIIFHRYHEAGQTKIREKEMIEQGKQPKVCENVVGYDANALYLWAIMQEMPTGAYVRRREENGFKRESSVKLATEWLEWESERRGIPIRHQVNDTEKRIGNRRLAVDGFHGPSQTVFQFHGCYWHGDRCYLNQKEFNEVRKKPMSELREETEANSKYIRNEGFNLVEMKECEWRTMKRTDPEIQRFLENKFNRPLDHRRTLTTNEIVNAVKDGSLFGVVEVDIQVPDDLKPHFSEMCPIFKNTEISRDDIGEFMKEFAEEEDIMPRPRRSLIGSYFGKKILLATPLLKWYLEHGLVVTRIYQVVEYTPKACFKPFGEAVSDARRAGDADPNKAIIADTMKLVGNSSYGKTITDQERHREVKFCSDAKASRLVNDPFFRQIDEIDENTYEVQSSKKKINLNLPIQIGFFVYQYAKLRMLQFYYDFIDKYVDRSDFQYCEMDTDSAYIALSGRSIESLVKEEMREEFEEDKCNWFPRTDTAEHRAYDKRTPGLFKVEWEGQGIIGLCSKTYYCFGSSDKFSCKGVNKKCNEITKDKYLNVLRTKQSASDYGLG
ncbi:Zinc finger and SCAN domain-containing protein 22 [Exaiptasia diaphana]|nr:Zinc finger and SCAN domain-containing protein 22 [Exaiptasia diaphana]